MRTRFLLPIAAALAFPAGAQTAPQPPTTGPDITVTGDNRVVCRYVTRTATRMRRGRICRTLSAWRDDPDRAVRAPDDANATIDGAADTLELISERSAVRSEGALGPR
jgi:hypothetical protein